MTTMFLLIPVLLVMAIMFFTVMIIIATEPRE